MLSCTSSDKCGGGAGGCERTSFQILLDRRMRRQLRSRERRFQSRKTSCIHHLSSAPHGHLSDSRDQLTSTNHPNDLPLIIIALNKRLHLRIHRKRLSAFSPSRYNQRVKRILLKKNHVISLRFKIAIYRFGNSTASSTSFKSESAMILTPLEHLATGDGAGCPSATSLTNADVHDTPARTSVSYVMTLRRSEIHQRHDSFGVDLEKELTTPSPQSHLQSKSALKASSSLE